LTLRVATGPVGSDSQKFLAAFVRSVADAHHRVRLQIVPMADREASAKALTAGAADLAVVRSDELTGITGQTIVILRRDVVGLVIPSHAPIEADLKQRSHINASAQAAGDAPDFSQRIRAGLPRPAPASR
jgi:hypothetical protein